MTTTAAVPADVIAAWGVGDDVLEPITGGLINDTFAVRRGSERRLVLQRLHPIFRGEVNLDIEALGRHLRLRSVGSPQLVRTRDGKPWLDVDGRVWRALTYIDGRTVHKIPDPSWAEAAGVLIARFHKAVADWQHDYHFTRAGVHDTEAHLGKLAGALAAPPPADGADWHAEATALGHDILAASDAMPDLPADLPLRHCHGDLKISNVMFAPSDPLNPTPRAGCLVDLDTIGRSTIAFELGDAMRSWCNPHGEDAGAVKFELPIFAAAMYGYLGGFGKQLSAAEQRSIAIGLERVCVELAARFAVDVFADSYFGWDPARFPSRRAHNLVRARGQLALAGQVAEVRSGLADAIAQALKPRH